MMIRVKNDKWGFYNSATKSLIPCCYDSINDFQDGLAVVECHGKWGVINETGQIVIPFCFTQIDKIANALYEVSTYYSCLKCLYNAHGCIVNKDFIPFEDWLQEYDIVIAISNGVYHVKKDETESIVYNKRTIYSCQEREHISEIRLTTEYVSIHIESKGYVLCNFDGAVLMSELSHLEVIENVGVIADEHEGRCIFDFDGNKKLHRNYQDVCYNGDGRFLLTYFWDYQQKESEKSCIYDITQNMFVVKSKNEELFVDFEYDWCDNFEGEYAVVCRNQKYGYIDKQGDLCIPCVYDYARKCFKNVGIVKEEGTWSFVNLGTGEKYGKYDSLGEFTHGFCIFCQAHNYGIVDYNGQVILNPLYNNDITIFPDAHFDASRGYGSVKRYNRFNKEGRIILNINGIEFTLSDEIVWVEDFSGGLAVVEDVHSKKGFINESGDLVISCRFTGRVSGFADGVATVSVRCEDSWHESLINKEGHLLVEQCGEQVLINGNYQLAFGTDCDALIVSDGVKWGLLDRESNPITKQEYDYISFLGEEFFCVKQQDKCGVIDAHGNKIISCKYPGIRLHDNVFEVISHGNVIIKFTKGGLIMTQDENGMVLLPPNFDEVCSFQGEFAKVKVDNKWGLVDKKGHFVLPCTYSWIGNFDNNQLHCKLAEQHKIVFITNLQGFDIPNCDDIIFAEDIFILITRQSCYNNFIFIDAAGVVLCIINQHRGNVYSKEYKEHKEKIWTLRGIMPMLRYETYEYPCTYLNVFINNKCALIESYFINLLENQHLLDNEKRETHFPYGNDSRATRIQNIMRIGVEHIDGDILKYRTIYDDVKQPVIIMPCGSVVKQANEYIFAGPFSCGRAKCAKTVTEERFRRRPMIGCENSGTLDITFDKIKITTHKDFCGFLDEYSKEIITCQFDSVSDFVDGISIVSKSGRVGVINIDGEIIVPIQYDEIEYAYNKYFKVVRDEQMGLLDVHNNEILPCIYKDIQEPIEGRIAVKTQGSPNIIKHISKASAYSLKQENDLWGFVDFSNRICIEPLYSSVRNFKNGFAVVFDTQWKLVDLNGNIIFLKSATALIR